MIIQEEADFPVIISRRSSGDIVYFNSNKSYIMFVLVIILLTWSTRGDVLIMKTCLMVSLIVIVSYIYVIVNSSIIESILILILINTHWKDCN